MQLNLQPNKTILLHNNRVYRWGNHEFYTDELLLTNFNMIYIRKGFFGRIKNILKYPLDQVKVQNGQVQVRMAKNFRGTPQLQIYFKNTLEFFSFQSRGKKQILKWVGTLHQLLDNPAAQTQPKPESIPLPEIVSVILRKRSRRIPQRTASDARLPYPGVKDKPSAANTAIPIKFYNAAF